MKSPDTVFFLDLFAGYMEDRTTEHTGPSPTEQTDLFPLRWAEYSLLTYLNVIESGKLYNSISGAAH